EKSLERAASALPFLCMMFLNLEWPAMGLQTAQSGKRSQVLTSGWPADQRVRRCGTVAVRSCSPEARMRELEAMSEYLVDGDLSEEPDNEVVHWMAPKPMSVGPGGLS